MQTHENNLVAEMIYKESGLLDDLEFLLQMETVWNKFKDSIRKTQELTKKRGRS